MSISWDTPSIDGSELVPNAFVAYFVPRDSREECSVNQSVE